MGGKRERERWTDRKMKGWKFMGDSYRQQPCITSFEHAVLPGDWACSPPLLWSGKSVVEMTSQPAGWGWGGRAKSLHPSPPYSVLVVQDSHHVKGGWLGMPQSCCLGDRASPASFSQEGMRMGKLSSRRIAPSPLVSSGRP